MPSNVTATQQRNKQDAEDYKQWIEFKGEIDRLRSLPQEYRPSWTQISSICGSASPGYAKSAYDHKGVADMSHIPVLRAEADRLYKEAEAEAVVKEKTQEAKPEPQPEPKFTRKMGTRTSEKVAEEFIKLYRYAVDSVGRDEDEVAKAAGYKSGKKGVRFVLNRISRPGMTKVGRLHDWFRDELKIDPEKLLQALSQKEHREVQDKPREASRGTAGESPGEEVQEPLRRIKELLWEALQEMERFKNSGPILPPLPRETPRYIVQHFEEAAQEAHQKTLSQAVEQVTEVLSRFED